MSQFEWQVEHGGEILAGRAADDLALRNRLEAPIDPLDVVRLEQPWLRADGADFKNSFDGKLKYIRDRHRFLLFFNTKYDVGCVPGAHHPRTRFSIAHELGHYFIDAHREYLMGGGLPHPSKGEFRQQDRQIEREADAFAAALLLPTHLAAPVVHAAPPSLHLVDQLSRDFRTSLVCSAFRLIALTRDPCAVAGIRAGAVAWMFPSERLIAGSCYPRRGPLQSPSAQDRWRRFTAGDLDRTMADSPASAWFSLFGREVDDDGLRVQENYLPVKVMNTLVVLLTVEDDELFAFGAGDEDEEEAWTKERHDRGD